MPLILLLLADLASAQGSALWLAGPADPKATVDLVDHPLDLLLPDQSWSAEDARALDALAAELAAVRPLVEVFDGELEIMGRLERAIADVHVLRGDADRELLARALRFQGFAVRRYFQDGLATDPAAEPYRIRMGEAWEIRPWVDAVALEPDREAVADDVPEEPERVAFGETRAHVLAMPRATLDFGALPSAAMALVDGRLVEHTADGTVRAALLPGMHRAAVFEDGAIAVRGRVRLGPGEVQTLKRRPTRGEMAALAAALDGVQTPVRLDPIVVDTLALLDPPVHLVVPAEGAPIVYAVEDTWAVYEAPPVPEPVPVPVPEEPPPPSRSVRLGAVAAVGWMFDPRFADNSGASKSAAHAFASQIGATLWGPIGPIELSAGLEVAVPIPEASEVDVGGRIVRARLQPWIGVGPSAVPLTLTVGGLLPSHIALGIRTRWPPDAPAAISAGWVQGIPLGEGEHPAHLAWLGVTGSVPLAPSR